MNLLAADLDRLLDADGDEVARDLRWRLTPGEVVAVVTASSEVRDALSRILLHAATSDGQASVPRSIPEGWSSRLIAIKSSPASIRSAGEQLLAAEQTVGGESDPLGHAISEAVEQWVALGGYALEAFWEGLYDETTQSASRVALPLRRWMYAASVACGPNNANAILLDFPTALPHKLASELAQRIKATSATTLMLEPGPPLTRAATTFVTVEKGETWTYRGNADDWGLETRRRRSRGQDRMTQWILEEERLREHMQTAKERAALNSKNASRGDAAESRWKRFLTTRPSSLDTPTAE